MVAQTNRQAETNTLPNFEHNKFSHDEATCSIVLALIESQQNYMVIDHF